MQFNLFSQKCKLSIETLSYSHLIPKMFQHCIPFDSNCTGSLKDCIPKELTSSVVHNFQCGLCICNQSYYVESIRNLNFRIGEHIRISGLTKKRDKPTGSAVSDHYFVTIHHLLKSFCVLIKENRKSVLELKESPKIKRDKPTLNRSIRLAPLYPFDRASLRLSKYSSFGLF